MSGGVRDPVKIVANIFISFIGAGVLGLPYAFKRVSMLTTCWDTFHLVYIFRLAYWRVSW